MSKTVFILGAGASKEAGAPLTKDFLDKAESIAPLLDDRERKQFDIVFKALASLRVAQSKALIDLDNIESVFSAFEMGKLLKIKDWIEDGVLDLLPDAMRHLIVTTLERSILFAGQSKQFISPPPYDAFVKLVGDMNAEQEGDARVSVITFNYDICLDYSFYRARCDVAYLLGDGTDERGIKLLKLHGSINWLKCTECGSTRPWRMAEYLKTNRFGILESCPLFISRYWSSFSGYSHCQTSSSAAMIVPPTWNKTQHHEAIAPVWRAAATELANAEDIFVIGYSYPSTDQFFHSLYALGTLGATRLKRFWVFNPDNAVDDRFRTLLGQAATNRYRFVDGNFAQAISDIRRQLKVKEQQHGGHSGDWMR